MNTLAILLTTMVLQVPPPDAAPALQVLVEQGLSKVEGARFWNREEGPLSMDLDSYVVALEEKAEVISDRASFKARTGFDASISTEEAIRCPTATFCEELDGGAHFRVDSIEARTPDAIQAVVEFLTIVRRGESTGICRLRVRARARATERGEWVPDGVEWVSYC